MKIFTVSMTLLSVGSPIFGYEPLNLSTTPCGVVVAYFDFGSIVRADLALELAMIAQTAEATGLPRGSFASDFTVQCAKDQSASAQKTIGLVFDHYREILK